MLVYHKEKGRMGNEKNMITSSNEFPFEYSFITENILLGTNACCVLHSEEDLIQKGVTADICLEPEKLELPSNIEISLWLSVKNSFAPTLDQLLSAVALLTLLDKEGKKVYVHSQNGHGRAPTVVAAYFVSQGTSVNDAIAKIHEKRSSIHLTETQHNLLISFEKKIHEKNTKTS